MRRVLPARWTIVDLSHDDVILHFGEHLKQATIVSFTASQVTEPFAYRTTSKTFFLVLFEFSNALVTGSVVHPIECSRSASPHVAALTNYLGTMVFVED